MAKQQPPISKTRVQRNRLIAVQTADSAERDAQRNVTPNLTWTEARPLTSKQQAAARWTVPGSDTTPTATANVETYAPASSYQTMPYVNTPSIQPPTFQSAATYPSYVAPQYTAAAIANPYAGYTQGLAALADQMSSNAGTEMSAIQDRFNTLRDRVMSQFGNTQNPELIAARDIALAELSRQAQDATKQVAANYQAAQADQVRFAEQQRALGAELGAQNAGYANLAAGNIAAYADQAGVSDAAGLDVSRMLASRAPREQALAAALGLSGGMFESSMGTSLGEQQMAIQGQIARDLAARGGQVSTSTAQQIAAAQMADREAQRQAYLNLALQESGALDQYRNQMSERDFALRQAMLQGGVEAGRFDVAQAQQSEENRIRQDESAYNRWLAEQELGLKGTEQANIQAERDRQYNLEATKAGLTGETMFQVPPYVQSLVSGYTSSKPKSPTASSVASNLEMLGSIASGGLTNANEMEQALVLWGTISSDKEAMKYLTKQGITTLNGFVSKTVGSPVIDTTAAQQRVMSGQSTLSQEVANLGIRGR
jgi:hypothetical protein